MASTLTTVGRLRRRLRARRGTYSTRAAGYSDEVLGIGRQLGAKFREFFAALSDVPMDLVAVYRSLVTDAYAQIQERTPVDTGRARGGWGLRVGSAHAARKGEFTARITNSVSYIVYLEYGWSKQAPRGMVRISLIELHDRLGEAVAEYFSDAA